MAALYGGEAGEEEGNGGGAAGAVGGGGGVEVVDDVVGESLAENDVSGCEHDSETTGRSRCRCWGDCSGCTRRRSSPGDWRRGGPQRVLVEREGDKVPISARKGMFRRLMKVIMRVRFVLRFWKMPLSKTF